MTKSIFFQRLSATAQFILGFVLGISLIAGISGTLIFAYYQRMSVLPQKPEFPEAEVTPEAATPDVVETEIEPLESNTVDESIEETEAIEEEPIEEAPPPEVELPPNAYRATVTWPEGLSLRAEPDASAERVGGIETKATIIVLENSADGSWQRVRLPWNGQEGWVKAGNVRKL